MTDQVATMRMADCGYSQANGWQVAWAQVIGQHHPTITEDSVSFRDIALPGEAASAICLALADGVGGGARGEVASAALVNHCAQIPDTLFGDIDGLEDWMIKAEDQVQLKLREVSLSPGAATLAAAWIQPDGTGHILRIGDARLYCFGEHSSRQLTVDQTYAHVGETPPPGATPDDPARMVGTGFSGALDIQSVNISKQDLLLLCSDGLHRALTTEDMAEFVKDIRDLGNCALRLAQAARMRGSIDDISVMLLTRTSKSRH